MWEPEGLPLNAMGSPCTTWLRSPVTRGRWSLTMTSDPTKNFSLQAQPSLGRGEGEEGGTLWTRIIAPPVLLLLLGCWAFDHA